MKYTLLIEYDGTEFAGWQRQQGAATVQQAIEEALAVVLRETVSITGSGRTDAGVHARGQVAHFDATAVLDPYRLRASLNGVLPPTIAIRGVAPAPEAFHARYDARSRRYHYHIATAPFALERRHRALIYPIPDFEKMNAAALNLLGTHDFDTFCRTASATENRVCTVYEAAWCPEEHPTNWRFCIVADRFLHGMVRAVVGTLLEIGQGKRPADDIAACLAAKDRRVAGPAAPAKGLVLEQVDYPQPLNFAAAMGVEAI